MSLLTNSLWLKQNVISYILEYIWLVICWPSSQLNFYSLIPVFWRKKLTTFQHSDWFLNRIFMSTRRESVQSLKCSFQNNSSVKFKFIAKFIWDLSFYYEMIVFVPRSHLYDSSFCQTRVEIRSQTPQLLSCPEIDKNLDYFKMYSIIFLFNLVCLCSRLLCYMSED